VLTDGKSIRALSRNYNRIISFNSQQTCIAMFGQQLCILGFCQADLWAHDSLNGTYETAQCA
jgi:hypothetical protein